MSGDMYEAVTRLFRFSMHISAIAVCRNAGSRLLETCRKHMNSVCDVNKEQTLSQHPIV